MIKRQLHLVTSCIFTDNDPIIKLSSVLYMLSKMHFVDVNSNPNGSILRKRSEMHKGHDTPAKQTYNSIQMFGGQKSTR